MNKSILLLLLTVSGSCEANRWSKFSYGMHKYGRFIELCVPVFFAFDGYRKFNDRHLFRHLPNVPDQERQLIMQEAEDIGISNPENLYAKRVVNFGGLPSNAGAAIHGLILPEYDNENIRRFVLRHELSHIKHKDVIVSSIIRVGVYYGLNYIGYKYMNQYKNSKFAKIWRHAYLRGVLKGLPTIWMSNYIHSFLEARADRDAIDSPEMRDAAVDLMNQIHGEMDNHPVMKLFHKVPNWAFPFLTMHPSKADRIAQAYRLFPREEA